MTYVRFRLFGKRAACAVSLISETMADARFHLAGKRISRPRAISPIRETRPVRDFANSGSLILEIVADSRLELLGKRGRCAIVLISESAGLRDFSRPGSGSVGLWAIPLIWETRPTHDFDTFGNHDRCARPLGRKTDPLVG